MQHYYLSFDGSKRTALLPNCSVRRLKRMQLNSAPNLPAAGPPYFLSGGHYAKLDKISEFYDMINNARMFCFLQFCRLE